MEYGILSLLPVCIALVLAFVTKDALVSILIGVLFGVIVSGQNIVTGFTGLLQSALGNADFIWILAIEVFVGIGTITDSQIGVDVLFRAFPFNFYCWATIIIVLLISAGVIPQFGPMRTAERRAQEEGKVLADNAVPLPVQSLNLSN